MPRHVVLLRGINVGGRRRIAMAELRELLGGLGYGDVRTLLQSGNVVLSSDLPPDRLAAQLERQIEDGLGVDPAVIVRSRDELAAVVEHDPLRGVATDPRRYQVSFLSGEPDPDAAAALVEAVTEPERAVVSGREIYAWHPDGLQRSELAKLLSASERRLGVAATARNWNTVTKLLALAEG